MTQKRKGDTLPLWCNFFDATLWCALMVCKKRSQEGSRLRIIYKGDKNQNCINGAFSCSSSKRSFSASFSSLLRYRSSSSFSSSIRTSGVTGRWPEPTSGTSGRSAIFLHLATHDPMINPNTPMKMVQALMIPPPKPFIPVFWHPVKITLLKIKQIWKIRFNLHEKNVPFVRLWSDACHSAAIDPGIIPLVPNPSKCRIAVNMKGMDRPMAKPRNIPVHPIFRSNRLRTIFWLISMVLTSIAALKFNFKIKTRLRRISSFGELAGMARCGRRSM